MRTALHIVHSIDPHQGGTSVAVPELANATRNYRNRVLCFKGEGDPQKLRWPNVEITTSTKRALPLYKEIFSTGILGEMIAAADIVHTHGLWLAHSAVGSALASRKGIPLMISAHGMLQPWALKRNRWAKLVYSALAERPAMSRASCLRALTMTEALEYRTFGIRAPIAVIPNGTKTPKEINEGIDSKEFLTRHPKLKNRKLLLFLSRIHHKKGLDILCRAWASIQATHPDAILVLAGPDEDDTQKRIQSLIDGLGISDRVFFTGLLQNQMKWSALKSAHCFILPSYSEGFSISILEALACLVPVIITKQCNFPEIASAQCGWVIDADELQLRNAILECLNQDGGNRMEQTSRGFDLVKLKFSWDRVGLMIEETYDWILGGSKPANTEILSA